MAALPAVSRSAVGPLIETTKPRITRLVAITAFIGVVLGLMAAGLSGVEAVVWPVLWCVLGTAICAASANALNQWWERDRDALMDRTLSRPLPSGRVAPATVMRFALALALIGVVTLALGNGVVTALLGAFSIGSYVLLYTPTKVRTTWCTLIGAVPGAMPPLIGWAAADHAATANGLGSIGWAGGLSLFTLMVVWQMPHFWAIAWKYRDDYAQGGFRVLPVVDRDGHRTARSLRVWSLALVPASLLPWWAMPELIGPAYVLVAIAMGIAFAIACMRLAETRARADATRVFFISIAHLPLLLTALALDAAWTRFV